MTSHNENDSRLFSFSVLLLTYYKVQCPVSKYDPMARATCARHHIPSAPISVYNHTMTKFKKQSTINDIYCIIQVKAYLLHP